MSPMYTGTDCVVLRKCLETNPYGWAHDDEAFFQYDQFVLEEIKRSLQETPDVESIVKTKLDRWVRRTFGGPFKRSILHFLFKVSYEEIGLYVNNEEVLPFVRWRCRIGK
jgi:hypothetical protein